MKINRSWLFYWGVLAVTILVSKNVGASEAPSRDIAQVEDTSEQLEQIERYSSDLTTDESMGQVTSVEQLRDVAPGDWAYEALRSLVERYGCIEGYPDRTYRGNRALTRYEFAAGLNSCLNAIERLVAVSSNGLAPEDLERLQRLAQEFEAELATLGARVDNLEGRVAFLEDNQFSTTTKLEGQAIFALGQLFEGEDVSGNEVDQVTVLGDRVRLELNTSFTGEDLLFTRLATGNFPAFADETGYFQGELGFAQPEDNDVALEVLYYTFPITDSTQIYVAADGGAADDFTPTLNFLDGDGAEGAVSAFGTRNPIYFTPADAGLAIIQQFGDSLELSAGYLADPANEADSGSGLFNGPYSAIGQLTFTPSDAFSVAFTYVHNYNQSDTGTGTRLANFRFFVEEAFGADADTPLPVPPGQELNIEEFPTVSNSYGVKFSWSVTEQLIVGGWGAYTNTRSLSSPNGRLERGSLDIVNWATTLALVDLGKEGSILGFVVGSEPFVVDESFEVEGIDDDDFSLHVEGFYQFPVTDNIAITPGVVWITAPNGDSDNEDQIIGTLRTTFSF